ncbi:MAG: hypothetical protein IPF42_19630 [Candidatus Microthrix sp.]|nr:hypothetical protein [Candidatus Microthrix sp.]
MLLAEIAQSDLCDRLHGHTPNAWYADRTRQARSAASARMRTAQRLHARYGECWLMPSKPGWSAGNTSGCSTGPPTAPRPAAMVELLRR